MTQDVKLRAKFITVISLIIALIYIGRANTSAQAFPEYTSGVQIANLESTDTQVLLTLYDDNGAIIATRTDSIPASGSRTYFPIADVLGSGCVGLAHAVKGAQADESRIVFPRTGCVLVITSSQRLAAVVNLLSADLRAGASYLYERIGANTVHLPLLFKNNGGFNTWLTVQNLGPGVANVQVSYTDGTEVAISIAKDKAHSFYQAQETHTQAVFAGTVTSDQPVFVSVIQENGDLIFAYTGFNSGASNPVFPLINANNAGYLTGLQIQNIGAQATGVEVTYTPSEAGTACKETQIIEAGLSKTFALSAFDSGANSDCIAKQTFVGSARVTGNSANQPLTGIANQLLPGINGEAYGAFDPVQATQRAVMPLIMDRNSGFYTGFSLQNIGSETTNIQCTFTNSSYSISRMLQPGESFTDIQQNRIGSAYIGGATCTADAANAKIVAVVNELGSRSDLDHLLVYESIPSH